MYLVDNNSFVLCFVLSHTLYLRKSSPGKIKEILFFLVIRNTVYYSVETLTH